MKEKGFGIKVRNRFCMICGKEIKIDNRIKAHLIPKMLKPKENVIVFLHKECETKINKLYVGQQKKTEAEKIKEKALNLLKDFKLKIKLMEKRINDDRTKIF